MIIQIASSIIFELGWHSITFGGLIGETNGNIEIRRIQSSLHMHYKDQSEFGDAVGPSDMIIIFPD